MENENQVYITESMDEEESHDVDSSQKSILLFFKPVTSKMQKPSLSQGDCNKSKGNLGCSSGQNDKSLLKDAVVAKDDVIVSSKSKKKKRSVDVNMADNLVISSGDTEKNISLLEESEFIEKKKPKKKKVKSREQKDKCDSKSEIKEDSGDQVILETQKYNEKTEGELGCEDVSVVKTDIEFSRQDKNSSEESSGKVKVNKRKKSHKSRCMTGDQGKEMDCHSGLFESDMIDEKQRKRKTMKETGAKQVEVDNGIQLIEKDVVGEESEVKVNRRESADKDDSENKDNEIVNITLSNKNKKKEKLYDSREEDQLLMKNMENDSRHDINIAEEDDAAEFEVQKSAKRRTRRNRIKDGDKTHLDVSTAVTSSDRMSIKDSTMTGEACNDGSINKRRLKGFSERQGCTESKKEDSFLLKKEASAKVVIKDCKNIAENRRKAKADKEIKLDISNKRVSKGIEIEYEEKGLKEMTKSEKGEDFVTDEQSFKRAKTKKRKPIVSDSSDVDNGDLEMGVKETLDCKDELSADDTPVWSQRSRRQNVKAVNYADEFLSIDDDEDDDFQPQRRKSKQPKASGRSNELKSNDQSCSQRKSKSRQVSEKGNKKGNVDKGVSDHELDLSKDVVKNSVINSKKEKIPEEVDGKVLQKDLEIVKAPATASNCSKTSFLAKFTMQKIVRCEENVIIEQEAALPCLSHILQINSQEREWYQNAATELRPIVISKEADDDAKTPPLVSNRSSLVFLLNLPKQPREKISVKTQSFVPLTSAIVEILKCNPSFPLLKLLKDYISCQLNVVKLCLAKVEVPKSNLKTIWEKQGKWAKSETLGIDPVEIQPIKPAIDIRNMFTKAKSKAPREPISIVNEATVSEEKSAERGKGRGRSMADSLKSKPEVDKGARRKKNRKKGDEKKKKDVELDSSIEIVSIEETVLKTGNTIEESFTKVSERKRYTKESSERGCEKICESEQEERDSSFRPKPKKVSSKNATDSDDDFVTVQMHTDRKVSSRKSRRQRKKDGEKDVNDCSGNETNKIEDKDIAEDGLVKKKRVRRKNKMNKERDYHIVNEISENRPVSEKDCVSPIMPRKSKRTAKKMDKTAKNAEDSEDAFVSSKNIVDGQISNPAQHDIRMMFGNTKHFGKERNLFETKNEINTKVQCKSTEFENEVVIKEVDKYPTDKIEELPCKIEEKEVAVVAEQKPNTVDIRCLFRKSFNKDAGNVSVLKECGVAVGEKLSQTELKMNVSKENKECFPEQRSNIVDANVGEEGEEKIEVKCIDSRCHEKKNHLPKGSKELGKLKEDYYEPGKVLDNHAIEKVKPGERVILELSEVNKEEGREEEPARGSEEERNVVSVDSREDISSESSKAVGLMKNIRSYFKPSGKRSEEHSVVSVPASSLIMPFVPESSSEESKMIEGDIQKKSLPTDGEHRKDNGKTIRLSDATQGKAGEEKAQEIDAASGNQVGKEGGLTDEPMLANAKNNEDDKMKENDKDAKNDELLPVADRNKDNFNHYRVDNGPNGKECTEVGKTMPVVFRPSGEQCTRGKRKREPNSVVESHSEQAQSATISKEAKRVKVCGDAELKEEPSGTNFETNRRTINLESDNINVKNMNIGIDLKKDIELENYEIAENENRLNAEVKEISRTCKRRDVNEDLTTVSDTIEGETLNEVSQNSDDEIMAFHNRNAEPSSISRSSSSAASSSSEDTNDSTEVICSSDPDIGVEETVVPESGFDEVSHSFTGSELEEKQNTEVTSDVPVSNNEVGPESDDLSPKGTEESAFRTDGKDDTESVKLNERTAETQTAELSLDLQVAVASESECHDNSLQSENQQNNPDRRKRKRKASSVSCDDDVVEQNGRRRSSRVKQREEQKLEEDRKKKEELEKIFKERIQNHSPEMKKRRKSRKASENASDSLKKEDSCSEEKSSGILGMEEPGNDGVSDNFPVVTLDSTVVAKTDDPVEVEEIIELPQIDEDYINSSLLWTEKYAPARHGQVIGNRCQTREIFEWLSIWKEKHEHFVMKFNSKPRGRADDRSYFEDSSDDEDDENISNTFVVIGKVGCGSTATVYACAQELGYKVLEMHPSNYRAGKQIQALLGEATQSHQVKRKFHGSGGENPTPSSDETQGTKNICSFFGGKVAGDSNVKNAQNDDIVEVEKGNEPNSGSLKESSQENVVGEMSLVLFEQADVVFEEQDKGFWFGLNELRRQAKRPIIITANDPSLTSRLDGESYEAITMNYAEEQSIVSHLLAMCLAEHVKPARSLVENIVKDCNRDIRKSILKLQFTCEQWIKPCHKIMESVIETLSKVDLSKNQNEDNKANDVGFVKDSKIEKYKSADFQVDRTTSKSLVPFDENPKSEEWETAYQKPQTIDSIDEDSKVISCVTQIQDFSLKEPKMAELGLRTIEIENSIQCDLKGVKIEETDHVCANLSREDQSLDPRTLSGTSVSEAGTSDLEMANNDVDLAEKKNEDLEVSEVVKEEALVKEEKLKEETIVAVIEGNDFNYTSEDQSCLFDMTKINKYSLCRSNPNLKQREKDGLDCSSDASHTLSMLSASADKLSLMDTIYDKWNQPSIGAHRHGWWYAKTVDGISEDEPLFEDCKQRDIVLEEIYKNTTIAYKCVHNDILEEYDKVSSSSSIAESDVLLEIYSELERCLHSSVKTDHRSLCVDTIPSLCIICKSEENRRASQFGRRSRRFLHYLDTTGLHLDSEIREKFIRTSFN